MAQECCFPKSRAFFNSTAVKLFEAAKRCQVNIGGKEKRFGLEDGMVLRELANEKFPLRGRVDRKQELNDTKP